MVKNNISRFSCKIFEHEAFENEISKEICFIIWADEDAPECTQTRIDQVIVHSRSPLKLTVTTRDQEQPLANHFTKSQKLDMYIRSAQEIPGWKLELFDSILKTHGQVESVENHPESGSASTIDTSIQEFKNEAQQHLGLVLKNAIIEWSDYPFVCPRCENQLKDFELSPSQGITFNQFTVKGQRSIICGSCDKPIKKAHLIYGLRKALSEWINNLDSQLDYFDPDFGKRAREEEEEKEEESSVEKRMKCE